MPKYICPPGNPLNGTAFPIEVDGPCQRSHKNGNELAALVEEMSNHPPPEWEEIYEQYADNVVRERLPAWVAAENPEQFAIALAVANPNWSVEDIASRLGRNRTSLYRWTTFMKAFTKLKAERKSELRRRTPRGKKLSTKDSQIFDAVDPASEEGNDSEDLD